MSKEMILGSAELGASLRFFDFEGGSGECSVLYECENFSARARLWTLDNPGNSLDEFFSRLAQSWRGWSGQISWIAWENDFSLVASHDGLGHIGVEVDIVQTEPINCRLLGNLVLEAGQLDKVAALVKRFLS